MRLLFTFFRSYSQWSKTDLPLLTRVAWIHKNLKQQVAALEEQGLPVSVEFKTQLQIIRQQPWGQYNLNNLDHRVALEAENKLETLKRVLPNDITDKAHHMNSIDDAIGCLRSRCQPNPYPKK